METYEVTIHTKHGTKKVVIGSDNKTNATRLVFNMYRRDKIFNDACLYASVDETIKL